MIRLITGKKGSGKTIEAGRSAYLSGLGRTLEKLDKLTGDDSVVTFTVSADVSELPASVTKFVD